MLGPNIRKALLSKGYFPKELPPAFTTLDFGNRVDEILKEWREKKLIREDVKSLGKTPCKKKRRGSYTYKIESAEAENISKPKRGYERRTIHITHPVPQALIAYELSENWRDVQKWLSLQRFSEDEIRVSESYERSIKGINFALHRAKKSYLESTSDWLVKTDISRFYPSIYTHSIPWAAYGKERVKQRMGYYKGSFADRLDLLVRSCNRNQTIGIPIGPETSRIISEVISSRIDFEFSKHYEDMPIESVDRLQDDWAVGLNTLEGAERVLSTISSVYRSYGLDINGSKTSIDHIVVAQPATWVSEIGAFLSHKTLKPTGSRLLEFLNLCLRLQAEHPSDPVINYALSVIENAPVSVRDVEAVESFLLKAAVLAPISMERICRIILNLNHLTNSVSKNRIIKRFIELAERNFERGEIYEVIWLLYTLRGLGRKVHIKRISEMAESASSSAVALILLDMSERGQVIGGLPKGQWEAQITEESILTDWTWLLGYEGFRHGWLNDAKGLMAKPFFKPMTDRNIVFYDRTRNIQRSDKVASTRRKMRRRQRREVVSVFNFLRGVNVGEY